METMRKLPRILPPPPIQFRSFATSYRLLQSPPSPEPPKPQLRPEDYLTPDQLTRRKHKNLTNHPQAPLPTKGFGPFTRDRETGKRLTFLERTEERAKEYLYSEPDPNQPLPPLLLRPPGLTEPPKEGNGHGKETRSWWRRELEIWFGRYQNPFDVKAQLERHRRQNTYHTEWSPKADRRSVWRTHGKFFMSPHALFKADRAKYAPNFVGQTISSPSHHFESVKFAASKKASLICIFSTQVASRMCKPYLEAVELTFASRPSVGVVRVQFEENWMKWAVIKYHLVSRYLRPRYTPEQQQSYIVTKKFVNRPEGEATHITNTQVGYVMLVDSESRIRWMATGMPWPGELETLKKGVSKLIGDEVKDFGEVDYEPEEVAQHSS